MMGAYVNPEEVSKEAWLAEHGTPLGINEDNGMFTAAGIAYSEGELGAFTDPRDPRPKLYFSVPVEKLHEVSPELKGYMGELPEGRKGY
jgi:hypothetical protein